MRLTSVIITLNEEKFIGKCIDSVKSFSDEIVVVDSGSTDRTLDICREKKVKLFHRDFDNYAAQKNFADSKASGEWIFSIDADEIAEEELGREIKKALENNDFDAYSIPRKNIIFGKFIRYTRWQPELDRHIWLFRKNKARWLGDVHEELEVKGKVGMLKSAKVHYQYETIAEFVEMLNRYSTLEAQEKSAKKVNFSFIQLIFQPIYNFSVRYFYRLGFLDGMEGFMLSMLMAIYHFLVWSKLWVLKNNEKQKKAT